ncbi:MAG TPA: hypothetical protein PK095_11130, partial [Myxococcota bacterium]|nr:hypothetical protein [Myxococcota bacterium]
MRRAQIPGFLLVLSAFACSGDDVPATSDTPNDTPDTGVQSDTDTPPDTEDTSETHDTDDTDDTDDTRSPGDTTDSDVPGDVGDATDTDDTGDTDGAITPSECSPAWLAPPIPTTSTCGGEGQLACALSDPEYADNGQSSCDRGLVEQGGRCVAGLRRQAFIADYRTSWEAWAVAFERDQLGFDEPWNWTMQLHAHNGYNNFADGYIAPNQHLSLTDQLEGGVRGINLDVVYAHGRLQLCHGGPPCIPTDRGFTRALLELRDWLQDNPLAIIMIRLEDRFPSPTIGGRDGVSALLDAYFGDLIVDPSTLGGATATSAGAPWPTRRELLALGKRVIVTRGTEKCSGAQPPEGCDDSSVVYDLEWFNVEMQDTDDCISASQNGGKLTTGRSEDRTAYTLGSLGADLINGDEVAAQARCSLSQIELDFIFAAEHSPFTVCGEVPEACPDPDHRVGRSVWSFAEGDRGERGPALLGSDGRWRSTSRTARHHFACTASPDPITPSDWVVTSSSGPYDDGASSCAALGGQFRFAAPVRAIQNEALTASAHGLPVWVAVERQADGAWSVNGALTCPATAAP